MSKDNQLKEMMRAFNITFAKATGAFKGGHQYQGQDLSWKGPQLQYTKAEILGMQLETLFIYLKNVESAESENQAENWAQAMDIMATMNLTKWQDHRNDELAKALASDEEFNPFNNIIDYETKTYRLTEAISQLRSGLWEFAQFINKVKWNHEIK